MKISFGDWRIEALRDLEKLDLPFGQWLITRWPECRGNLLHSARLYNHCYYRVEPNGFSQKVSHSNKDFSLTFWCEENGSDNGWNIRSWQSNVMGIEFFELLSLAIQSFSRSAVTGRQIHFSTQSLKIPSFAY